MAEGRFRQDLFYRLSGLTLELAVRCGNRPDDLGAAGGIFPGGRSGIATS